MNTPSTDELEATPPLTTKESKHSETGQIYLDVRDAEGNAWFTAQNEDGTWEYWRQYLDAPWGKRS